MLILLTAAVSCTPPPVKLNYQDRKVVDSLYKAAATPLSQELDSLCDLRRDDRLRRAVDSIYTARLAERQDIIKSLAE